MPTTWCEYPHANETTIERSPSSTLDESGYEDGGGRRRRLVRLVNVKVPSCCCRVMTRTSDGGTGNGEEGAETEGGDGRWFGREDLDGLVAVDITVDVERGVVTEVTETSERSRTSRRDAAYWMDISEDEASEDVEFADVLRVNGRGKMCLPTFVDIHTHIDKAHTCERSRNLDGTLAGADAACGRDAKYWTQKDAVKRMNFAISSAYAHGTSALRTHLMSGEGSQCKIAWEAFCEMREKWRGKVDLQGVSLNVLSFFRDQDKARELARMVKNYGGILGAAVSCSDAGGTSADEATTCGDDMPKLLDVVFSFAKEFELDVDFHVDENGNESSKGLLYISEAVVRNRFAGSVVCGHCCSLAVQPENEATRIIKAAYDAGVTVVSLPTVNQWLQNRDPTGETTPTRRGVTRLKELANADVPVCLSSDNTRDSFFHYGDCDMLEVFKSSVCIAHLDRPIGKWPLAVTATPAKAMKLGENYGLLTPGAKANMILFHARNYSELFSRSQHDRVVIRDGIRISASLPAYEELDEA